MGLQDESIKPGKVQKAFLGKMIKGAGKSIGRLFGGKQSATATPGNVTMSGPGKGGMLPQLLQKALDDGIVKTASKGKMMKAKYGKMMKARYGKTVKTELKADPTKPISSVQPSTTLPKDFLGKRKALGGVRASLGMLKGPAKAGAILGAALTVPVGKMLKKIQDKRKAKNRDEAKVKKMGGGMIQKPMGYKSGNTVRKDIKLGRALVEAFGSKKTINKMKANIQDQNRVKKYSIGTGPLGATKKRLQQGPSPSKQVSPDQRIGLAALPSSDTELKNTINQVKAKYASLKETARDELTPMKSDRVFSKYRRPDSAKEFYADKPGSKYEGMAKEAMQNRINYHKNKKMAGGMAKKYNRGGGADTGTAGESKSKMYVLLDKMKSRRAEDRITERDTDIPTRRSRSPQNLISNKEMRIKSLRQSAGLGYLPKPAIGKMGGGMMNKPMGYKSGTMVKARGCKLGRTRPTKMY
jgi:hypothetical protein